MGSLQNLPEETRYANYLPDEILLQILEYIPKNPASQSTIARLCLVSRQWYNIFISRLYEEPYITGKAFDLFVKTICPSKNLHVRRSALAGLVKVLDLTYLVHEGSKSTTGRLLNRTKNSLRVFKAPRASFGINCWAALQKCTSLRVLDLSLPFDGVTFEYIAKTIPKLHDLRELHIPNVWGYYEHDMQHNPVVRDMRWPPHLQHLQLTGSVNGRFVSKMIGPAHGGVPELASVALTNCTRTGVLDIRFLVQTLAEQLTRLEVRNLPAVNAGDLNNVLSLAPNLKHLTIDSDLLSDDFGDDDSENWTADRYAESNPLESLTITCSGRDMYQHSWSFSVLDLCVMIDNRFLGRLRSLSLQRSFADMNELDDNEGLLCSLADLDEENWDERRWHYAPFQGMYEGMSWEDWCQTPTGSRMVPTVSVFGEGLKRGQCQDVTIRLDGSRDYWELMRRLSLVTD